MKSIAIEKEYGSGDHEIGMKLAKKANLAYYDANIIQEASQRYDFPISILDLYDEKRTGSLLYDIALYLSHSYSSISVEGEQVLYYIKQTIQFLSLTKSCVFIGRGSTDILRKNKNGLSIFIYCSNKEQRINRVIQNENVTYENAVKLIEKKDRERKNYFNVTTNKKWKDRNNYDIELNTAYLSIDECVDILYSYLNKEI